MGASASPHPSDSARQFKSVIRDSARDREVGDLGGTLFSKTSSVPRAQAQTAVLQLLYGNACFCEAVAADPSCLSSQEIPSPPAEQAQTPPTAVVIACADCELPPEVVFRQSAGELVVVRVPANVLDCAGLDIVQDALENRGVRLVVVLGHTHCSAVEEGVQQWIELDGAKVSCKQYPLPLPEPSSPPEDLSSSPSYSQEATPPKRSFFSRLFGCTKPESAYNDDVSVRANSLELSSPRTPTACGEAIPDSEFCAIALATAIDDVAESRVTQDLLAHEHQWTEQGLQGAHVIARQCMESPFAARLDGVEWLRSLNEALIAADAKRRAISHDEDTVRAVSAANAKLGAQAMLKSLAKSVDQSIMRETQVVAAQLNHCTGQVDVLKTGWYAHRCYYYE
ncbi:hypothetical protein WJX72_010789 [[Myrmecia] bisecta]|uniref:Carbonic anhydrase n=1 Tax=[Myrmecia] bisecta TaxID=41462 RepID=A0AAW1Q890_9CHLO